MSNVVRNLPQRAARDDALLRIVGEPPNDEEAAIVLPGDDAANYADNVVNEKVSICATGDEQESDSDDVLEEDMAVHYESYEDDEGEQMEDEQYVSRSGVAWSANAFRAGRQPARNVFSGQTGFRRGLHPQNSIEAFMIIFDESIGIAVRYTNLYGRRHFQAWKPTTASEVQAFIGLHMLAGVFKAHHRQARELWSPRDGHPLFSATMSYERFSQLRASLRFDDPRRRDPSDKLAPIRTIIENLNNVLDEIYRPGPFLVVDEMLVEFHGRVSFRQYIPTKPGKYGIKLYWIVDNDNTMPLRCIVYTVQNKTDPHEQQLYASCAEAVVLKLSNKYLDCGRNITVDNFFTSASLGNMPAQRNTTLVGTLRGNRREIPDVARSVRNRQRGDSRHYYSNHSTICSFWDKGAKPVLLLSTMHGAQNDTNSREDGKPDIV